MPQEKVKEAIKLLGEENIFCLEDIFDKLQGYPPRLLRLRYRADNPEKLQHLDYLEHRQLLKTDDRRQQYWLSPYVLCLLRKDKTDYLLKIMNDIHDSLRKIYDRHLETPVQVEEILKSVKHNKQETLLALDYMTQAHNIWSGLGQGFPYREQSTITLSEGILKHKKFSDILEEYWNWNAKSLNTEGSAKKSLIKLVQIKQFFKKLWHDPVCSAVIATLVAAALTAWVATLF